MLELDNDIFGTTATPAPPADFGGSCTTPAAAESPVETPGEVPAPEQEPEPPTMSMADALGIFGTAPKEKEGVHPVQGLPESFLSEIYGGNVPEAYTREEIIEQTAAYIESRLAADGYCIIRDMPNWVYHALGYINSTLLKGYAKNPRTCKKSYQAKDDANVGSGIHAYSLQGQEGLEAECAIMPIECEGRGKKAVTAREEFEAEHPGKVPLPYRYGKDEDGDKLYIMEVLRGVDGSLREHEIIGPMLANSEKEVSLFWVDEKHGVNCKVRLDILCGYVLGDLKKCRDLDGFQWQIKDLRYDVQMGFYTMGAVACGLPLNPETGIPNFALIPCEAFYPYRAAFWSRKADKLRDDMIEAQRLLGLVKESTITGRWPNYTIPPHIHTLADISAEDLVVEF
jgi:hypothetical protein